MIDNRSPRDDGSLDDLRFDKHIGCLVAKEGELGSASTRIMARKVLLNGVSDNVLTSVLQISSCTYAHDMWQGQLHVPAKPKELGLFVAPLHRSLGSKSANLDPQLTDLPLSGGSGGGKIQPALGLWHGRGRGAGR